MKGSRRGTCRTVRGARAVAHAFAAALVLLATAAAAEAPRSIDAPRSVAVLPPRFDPVLEPVAMGLAAWMRERLDASDVAVSSRLAVEQAIAAGPLGTSAPGEPLDPTALVALGQALDGALLIDTELRFDDGTIELWMRVYEPREATLVGARKSRGAFSELGNLAQDALVTLLEGLGRTPDAVRQAPPPRLVDMAAYTRAIRAQGHGDFAKAWRAVEGRMLPTAVALREEIDAAARVSSVPRAQRARLLIAQGQLDAGWLLVRDAVPNSLDPVVVLAAGENAEARSNPRQMTEHYQRATELAPGDPAAQLGLGRGLALAKQNEPAGRALERAAALDPDDGAPLIALAALRLGDPAREAAVHLEAGRRAAAHFDAAAAEREWNRASELAPGLLATVRREEGGLHDRLGDPAKALVAYEEAVTIDGEDADTWTRLARTRRAVGDAVGAEKAYDTALALNGDSASALRGLGEIYTQSGRAAEAVPKLERAVQLEPDAPAPRRALAAALVGSAQPQRALAVLIPTPDARVSAVDLRLAADIHQSLGDANAAQLARAKAERLDPEGPPLSEALTRAMRLPTGADGRAQAQRLANTQRSAADVSSLFEELIASFPTQDPVVRGPIARVAVLGLSYERDWKGKILDWVHPLRVDLAHVGDELGRAVSGAYELTPLPETDVQLGPELARLRAGATSRPEIALVNDVLGTDALLVAELRDSDAGDGALELELHMLTGRSEPVVSVLANSALLPQGGRTFGSWNARALAPWSVLLVLLALPLRRGFGSLVVGIEYASVGKGFFSIRVSTKPEKAKAGEKRKSTDKANQYQRRLRTFSRFERHMVGRETKFRWLPARTLYVGVHGLLQEPGTDEVIGNYFEEKSIRLERGKSTRLDYDFRPKECAIEVSVMRGETLLKHAAIAVRGQPKSLRYAKDGSTHLYVGKGTHVIAVGVQGCVAERTVAIRELTKTSVLIDLDVAESVVFRDCSAAVEPYLLSDLVSAATALEAAGQVQVAHAVRGAHHKSRGEQAKAAKHFEAAGKLEDAAEMQVTSSASPVELKSSANLFEKAGDLGRAAETYRAAGDLLEAARAYEATYEYASAIECYRLAGEETKLAELLEKTGEYLEAAVIARKQGKLDRAISNLQQIDLRQHEYSDACRMLAEICEQRGDLEMAISKWEETIKSSGADEAPLELYAKHADLLERAGRHEEALSTWDAIRRRDLNFPNAGTRVEALRELVTAARAEAATRAVPVDASGGSAAEATGEATKRESRYEVLGEVGRGGMGIVVKARDKRLGRIVALKRLPESLRENQTAVQLFLREARAAAALNHPNIVTLFDADEEDGNYFITMELLEGFSLNALLRKRGKLSGRDAARIGAQICTGLAFAHERRIIHRDIKTANLFFTRDKVVKIMDFGLAKMLEEVRRSATVIGGTPYYMAPEQAAGEAVDHRADLYALGVTLFELATGSVPFRDGDVTYHHRHTPAPDPRTLAPDLPEPFAALILELMSKRADDRPASTADVGARLLAIAQTV